MDDLPPIMLGFFSASSFVVPSFAASGDTTGLNVLAVVLVLAAAVLRTLLHVRRLPAPGQFGPSFLLAALVVAAGFGSLSSASATNKALVVSLTLAVALFAPPLLVRTPRDCRLLIGTIAVSAVYAVVVTTPAALSGGIGRLGLGGTDLAVIGTGRAAGTVVIITGTVYLMSNRTFGWRAYLVAVPLMTCAVLVLIRNNGRAAVLSTAAILLVVGAYQAWTRRHERGRSHFTRRFFGLAGLGGIGYAIAAVNQPQTELRLLQISLQDEARRDLVGIALKGASASPFGSGWGSYRELSEGFADYPHNLVLEHYVESGWLSAVVLVVLILLALWRVVATHTFESILLGGVLLFALLNSMVSLDVVGNRMVYVLLISSLGSIYWSRGPTGTISRPPSPSRTGLPLPTR